VSPRPGPSGRRAAAATRSPRRSREPAPKLSIRLATPGDVPVLATLMAGSPLLRRYRTTAKTALDALTKGRAAGDLLIVAGTPGGRLVGMGWVVPSRILTGAAYLRLLLVGEKRQRAGVGAALLDAAETAARAVANHLVLLATTDNAGARRFYARHGYRHVGDLPGLARPDLVEALYWKPLRPHGRRLPV
jgi:GNAT superfamily N-acetyltransferase